MCIGSFSLHSKWIGLSKRYPNSSVLRHDVESDRLIGKHRYTHLLDDLMFHDECCEKCNVRESGGEGEKWFNSVSEFHAEGYILLT